MHFVNSLRSIPLIVLCDFVCSTMYLPLGWISLSRGGAESNIPEINKKLKENVKAYANVGQLFVDVCKGDREELCPLSDAIISDSISHIGNMAVRTQRKVTWDTKLGQVIGDDEANEDQDSGEDPFFVWNFIGLSP